MITIHSGMLRLKKDQSNGPQVSKGRNIKGIHSSKGRKDGKSAFNLQVAPKPVLTVSR